MNVDFGEGVGELRHEQGSLSCRFCFSKFPPKMCEKDGCGGVVHSQLVGGRPDVPRYRDIVLKCDVDSCGPRSWLHGPFDLEEDDS